jgi:hypothetical protein
MNLRQTLGWVAIPTRGQQPFRFVPFPSYREFCLLYRKKANNEINYAMLKSRSEGTPLNAVAEAYELTKQRVSWLEREFVRKLGAAYAAGLLRLEKGRRPDEDH